MDIIFKDNPIKIDIVTYDDHSYIHKQVERRDGKLFVRLKKRAWF